MQCDVNVYVVRCVYICSAMCLYMQCGVQYDVTLYAARCVYMCSVM